MIDRKGLAALALFAGLAACQQASENPDKMKSDSPGTSVAEAPDASGNEASNPAGNRPDDAGKSPDPVPPSDDPPKKSASPGKLPPAGAGFRFVGRWAAEADYCADKAWRFTSTSLNTPAGSVCRFSKVTPVGGGYDIAAHCTAEGAQGEEVLKIRFAESARAMLFESERIADAGLIYCGR